MNQIILVSGKQGSGKTTLTGLLLQAKGKIRVELRFANVIYKIHDEVRNLMDFYGIETPEGVRVKDGPLLQFLGTEWGRKTYGENVWVQATKNQVQKFLDKMGPHSRQPLLIVISDCRFKNEFDAFPEALRVRLECVKSVRKTRCEAWRENDTHQSETDLDNHVYSGLFDLIFDTQHDTPEAIAEKIFAHLERGDWVGKRATPT